MYASITVSVHDETIRSIDMPDTTVMRTRPGFTPKQVPLN